MHDYDELDPETVACVQRLSRRTYRAASVLAAYRRNGFPVPMMSAIST
jgi:hypothetical protein